MNKDDLRHTTLRHLLRVIQLIVEDITLIISWMPINLINHATEVRFASLLSGGYTTMTVINLLERKLAKRTSVHRL